MAFQDNPQSILSFRVGPVLCCAPSQPVESIIAPPKLTHPPGSDRAQPGIFRHGSHIVKVIDLRQRFGIEPEEQTTPGNLIITHFKDERFAFWVDQILDVFDFPTEGWGTLPAAIPRGVFSRTLLLNKKIHLYAEFFKLSQLNDLGYLKHYIQQLKQSEKKSPDKTTTEIKNAKPGAITQTEKAGEIEETSFSPAPQAAKSNTPVAADNTPATLNSPLTHPEESIEKKSEPGMITRQSTTASPAKAKVTPTETFTSVNKDKATTRNIDNKNTTANKAAEITTGKYTQPNSAAVLNSATSQVTLHSHAATGGTNKNNSLTAPAVLQNSQIASTTNAIASAESDDENTSSSVIAVIFLLLLLAVIGAGIYLFFSAQNESPMGITTIPAVPALHETTIDTELPEENMFNFTPEKATMPAEKVKPKTTNPGYRAEISQTENEITITVHEPDVAAKPDNERTETAAATEINNLPETATQITTTDTVNEPLPENPAVAPLKPNELTKHIAKEKPVREIIHIVVKGDTLWAIAKKYVHNPFLYPELARLSNIKNPNRIYPGDRVRIRFIKD